MVLLSIENSAKNQLRSISIAKPSVSVNTRFPRTTRFTHSANAWGRIEQAQIRDGSGKERILDACLRIINKICQLCNRKMEVMDNATTSIEFYSLYM